MNRSPNSGHWLAIALRGTKSNRDGMGARIKVVTTSGAQYNHMTSSVCYASSSYGPVHFGLGPDARAESIEIHWPSGRVQTLHDVAADQVLKVTRKLNGPFDPASIELEWPARVFSLARVERIRNGFQAI
jgi:hypothetical protein